MTRYIQWNGSKLVERHIHDLVFRHGDVHQVDDDEIALDLLTQPGDHFIEVDKSTYDKQNRTEPEEPLIDQTDSRQEVE